MIFERLEHIGGRGSEIVQETKHEFEPTMDNIRTIAERHSDRVRNSEIQAGRETSEALRSLVASVRDDLPDQLRVYSHQLSLGTFDLHVDQWVFDFGHGPVRDMSHFDAMWYSRFNDIIHAIGTQVLARRGINGAEFMR